MKRRIIPIVMALLVLFQISASAGSAYRTYTYDNTKRTMEAPDAVYFQRSIDTATIMDAAGNSIGELSEPADLFVDSNQNIYLCDAGNDRVLVLNKDFSFIKSIDGFINPDKEAETAVEAVEGTPAVDPKWDTFDRPRGIFVSDTGDCYIAEYGPDDGEGRIVVLDKDGNLKDIYFLQESDSPVLPDGFRFKPTKIAVDSVGRVFIVSQGFNLGIIEMNTEGEFVQCLGAPSVVFNPIEMIWRIISTEAQREQMQYFVPTEYNNVSVDDEDFVFVTTDIFDSTEYDSITPVRRLNAKGSDVLKVDASNKPYGDSNYAERGDFGGPSRLRDVIYIDNGIYATMDANRCRVFVYSNSGDLLFEFGGPPDMSDTQHMTYTRGSLKMPTSIAFMDDTFMVLDSEMNSVTLYKLTEYGNLILDACRANYQNEYDKEDALWEEVAKLNTNNILAQESLGRVAYRSQDYKTAMEYFRRSESREEYSKAYKFERQNMINDYFGIGAAVLVGGIILIIVLVKLRKKYLPPIPEQSYLGHVKYAGKLLFRPINAYWGLTREGGGSMPAAFTILMAAAIMSLLQARFTGFIFTTSRPEEINLVLELLKIIVPVFLFCLCNWCVTSLLDGEGNFKNIVMSTCYALTPMIILYPIAILLSNVMVLEEGDFYTVFVTIALIWIGILIVMGSMRTQDYSLGKTIWTLLLTILVMGIVVFLAVLFFALMQQLSGFIQDIISEVALRM